MLRVKLKYDPVVRTSNRKAAFEVKSDSVCALEISTEKKLLRNRIESIPDEKILTQTVR